MNKAWEKINEGNKKEGNGIFMKENTTLTKV